MIVDVDDPGTWPDAVTKLIVGCESELRLLDASPDDLVVRAGAYDEQLVSLLESHRLRAYHCARLLDHEVIAIRSAGLKPLNRELITDKLDAALRNGDITADQHDTLHQYGRLDDAARGTQVEGRICLALSTADFRLAAHGFNPLLASWGGEAIYFAHDNGSTGLAQALRSLGRPAIVCAQLNAAAIAHAYPSLTGPFVAVAAGWPAQEHSAEIVYGKHIPGEFIEDVWQPGSSGYDQFPDLVQV